jgi:Carbamoyltransferase C-terminus
VAWPSDSRWARAITSHERLARHQVLPVLIAKAPFAEAKRLGDPRKSAMRDKINAAVKYRDEWRPFAAGMLADAAADYLIHRAPLRS